MLNLTKIFEILLAKQNLNSEQMQFIIEACIQKELSDTQVAVFLALMRMKGETIEELTTAAEILLSKARLLNLGSDLIDIVGTGGDGKSSFNISTAASIVAASAGAKIAKHGNQAFSSKSGSADLLKLAKVEFFSDEPSLKSCLERFNICFLFAPNFHPALAAVRKAREELGIRSFFNFLGPLLNPARVKKQVLGVANSSWQKILAEVLVNLGSERVLAISSMDGLDEASIADYTSVIEFKDGKFNSWLLNPKDYGCFHPNLDKLLVKSPQESLHIILGVLAGEKGPARDAVILNAALALYCADIETKLSTAVERVTVAIDSGASLACFKNLTEFKTL